VAKLLVKNDLGGKENKELFELRSSVILLLNKIDKELLKRAEKLKEETKPQDKK
jgi:hypothetical protein